MNQDEEVFYDLQSEGENNATGPAASCFGSLVLVDVEGRVRPVTRAAICTVNSNFKGISSWGTSQDSSMERTGSQQDVKEIKKTFNYFQINVDEENVLQDKNRTEILKKIETIGGDDSIDKPDLFVLFVMSHGSEDGTILTDYLKTGIKAPPGKYNHSEFEDYTVKDIFEAINQNPNLDSCFKLIVVQACRGSLKEAIVEANVANLQGPKVNENACRVPILSPPKNSIVLFPTVEGTVAWRSTAQGTWLVNPLCDVLNEAEHGEGIFELITRTQSIICESPPNPTESQTPEMHYNACEQLLVQRCRESVGGCSMEQEFLYQSEAFPTVKNHGTLGDLYDWREGSGRGYGALIKLDPRFREKRLKDAVEQNLEIDVQVYRDETDKGITDTVDKILHDSKNAAYLMVFVVGRLVPSPSSGNLEEVCLMDSSSKTIPLRDIISTLAVGTNNTSLVGVPKFFFFIDNGKHREVKPQTPTRKTFTVTDGKGNLPRKTNNHAFSLTYICVGNRDLENLIKYLGDPVLRDEGRSLQFQLAKCVRLSNVEDRVRPNGIQTLFTSTIPKLIHFPKFKEAYVPPMITGEHDNWDLQNTSGWTNLVATLLPTENPRVRPTHQAWMLVAPAGQGKSRFTYEFAKILTRKPKHQVLRVTLRKHSNFLEKCDTNPELLEGYLKKFVKSCNLSQEPNKKYVILFDGFEKVHKLYGRVLKDLFKKIASDRHPLLVTTRPHVADVLHQYPVNFQRFSLENLNPEKQNLLVNQRFASKDKAESLFAAFRVNGIEDTFLGNPRNLITAITNGSNDLQIFSLFDSILQALITTVLIKCESVDKTNKKLDTLLRKRRELMVVVAAQLEKLDYEGFELTNTRLFNVNSVGVLIVEKNKDPVYLIDHFKDFLIALFLIHKHKTECNLPNFAEVLQGLYPSFNLSFATKFIGSYRGSQSQITYGYVIDLERLDD